MSDGVGKFIEAGGIRTHYHDVGSGAPVLLLHGSGPGVSAWSNWRGTIETLSATFRVIAPDVVGFGDTDRRPDQEYGMSVWVQHILDFLDALDLNQVHLIGNSMGGRLSLTLAHRVPKRVGKVVLMGVLGPSAPPTDGLKAVRAYTPGLKNMRQLLTTHFAYDASVATEEMIKARYEASARPEAAEAYPRLFANPQDNHLTVGPDEIRQMQHETLIVHGRDDRVILFSNALELFDLIPNAQLHGFSRCGHWVQIEQRAGFEQMTSAFLADDRAGG